MTILFAPSEGKRPGGDLPPIDRSAFCFRHLYDRRREAIERYAAFVATADTDALGRLFGIKSAHAIERYRTDLFQSPTMKAVERYDGVAYTYLKYADLPAQAQRYVDDHLLIFSNLFGPIRAKDRLPDYKLKQGEHIGSFAPEKFYREHFSDALTDELSSSGPIVDLRAGFYEKFYTVPLPHITMKFLKNGRSVSHWAKAYRGILLKEMARCAVMDEEQLMALQIENLSVVEIRQIGIRREILYEIAP